MRRIAWGTVLVLLVATAVCGGTVCAQQTAPTGRAENGCQAATTAAARLICADSHLAAVDSTLAKAYREAKETASPDEKKLLVQEQLAWLRERSEKCGLKGKDSAPIDELRKAKPCVEAEIKARLAALQNGDQASLITNSISRTRTACPSAKSASARLMCDDPQLAAMHSALAKAFLDAKKSASPQTQEVLAKKQRTWAQELNQKCGLTGRDSIDQLRAAKPCLEDAIKAQIAALQDGSQTSPAPLLLLPLPPPPPLHRIAKMFSSTRWSTTPPRHDRDHKRFSDCAFLPLPTASADLSSVVHRRPTREPILLPKRRSAASGS